MYGVLGMASNYWGSNRYISDLRDDSNYKYDNSGDHYINFEWRDAYKYTYPFLRFELLFFPKNVIPITVYADYYFKHESLGFGIRCNFNRRK